MSSETRYCWDTCVFIAWLRAEPDKPLADIQAVVREIDAGDAILIVPVTIFTELQRSKFTESQWLQFEQSLDRSSVIVANTTAPIAQQASQLRDKAEAAGRKVKTADAIVIATAMAYGADVLHTFDTLLLDLDGSDIVEGLDIKRPLPSSGQRGLL